MLIIKGIEYIRKEDAALYIDVYCYTCKKRMALSNSYQDNGRYYCERCFFSNHSIKCDECRERVLISNMHFKGDVEIVCGDCYKKEIDP